MTRSGDKARYEEAAQWLVAQILQRGSLTRDEAVRSIPKLFGRGLVTASDSGTMRLGSGLRAAFTNAADGMVTWDASKREWRLLDPASDSHHRSGLREESTSSPRQEQTDR